MRGRHERPRENRRSLQPGMLATGILAALATTGGVITVVGWTGSSTSETFTVHAAGIPRIAPPTVRTAVKPRISWAPVRIADDVGVQRYVVTRHLGAVAQVACDIPATARPRCIDRYAPAGYRATYTVQARHGAYWAGADSPPSKTVTVPGIAVPISVNGILIVPGADGTPVVAGGAAIDPSSPARPPSSGPSAPPGPGAVSPPGAYIPPAPPGQDSSPPEPPVEQPPAGTVEKPSSEPVTESGAAPKEPEPAVEKSTAATAD